VSEGGPHPDASPWWPRPSSIGVEDSPEPGTTPDRFRRPVHGRRDTLLGAAAILVVWYGASALYGSYWIPNPWNTIVRVTADIASGAIVSHALYTLLSALLGLSIGGIPAVVVPLALRRQPSLTAVLDPFIAAGYGVPKLTLTPLLMLWFGIDIGSKVAVVALSTFFVIYCHVVAGIRSVDARLVLMARLSGASECDLARHVVLPAAAPFMLAGARIAVPYAIGGAVVAELLSANRGLGYVVQFSASNFDTGGVFAALVVVAAIALAADCGLKVVERRLLPWRQDTTRVL
jgi:NitT/TauT family transport system permease protein